MKYIPGFLKIGWSAGHADYVRSSGASSCQAAAAVYPSPTDRIATLEPNELAETIEGSIELIG
jgi:hypothetical protein